MSGFEARSSHVKNLKKEHVTSYFIFSAPIRGKFILLYCYFIFSIQLSKYSCQMKSANIVVFTLFAQVSDQKAKQRSLLGIALSNTTGVRVLGNLAQRRLHLNP